MKVSYMLILGLWSVFDPSHPAASQDVRGQTRVRRTTDTDSLVRFLVGLRSGPIDLVVILDRSQGMGRRHFYLKTRKLAAYVLRYYTHIHAQRTRLALITFAKTARVDIDGISGDPIVKCQLFEGDDPLWDNVTYTKKNWAGTNVAQAFEAAIGIFKTGSISRPNSSRYLWILTDGNYKAAMDPLPHRDKLYKDLNVRIYATGVGNWLQDNIGNVRNLLKDDSHYGNLTQWLKATERTPVITKDLAPYWVTLDKSLHTPCGNLSSLYCDVVSGALRCLEVCPSCTGNGGATCSPNSARNQTGCACAAGNNVTVCIDEVTSCSDMTCFNGGSCQTGLGPPICQCKWNGGFQGKQCVSDENECLKEACGHGRCQDGVRDYTCTCAVGYCGFLCEDNSSCSNVTPKDKEPTEKPEDHDGFKHIMTAVIVGSIIMVIVVVIGLVCLFRRRQRRRGNRSSKNPPLEENGNASNHSAQTESFSLHSAPITPLPTRPDKDDRKPLPPVPDSPPSCRPPPPSSSNSYLESPPPSSNSYLESVGPVGRGGSAVMPPDSRPDLLQRIPTDPYFITARSYVEVFNYANLPENHNMEEWEPYVADLTSEHGLRKATMVRLDRSAWITSDRNTFLPTEREIGTIMQILHDQSCDVDVMVKKQTYRVEKNDGLMLQGWRASGRLREIVCIGKSRQFLVLGLMEDQAQNNPDQCCIEVDWVRSHIREQGL